MRRNLMLVLVTASVPISSGESEINLRLVSSVGRALHRYRRGHRFKSCAVLIFFQPFFSLLLKKCS